MENSSYSLNLSYHYFCSCSTLDIGMFGFITLI